MTYPRNFLSLTTHFLSFKNAVLPKSRMLHSASRLFTGLLPRNTSTLLASYSTATTAAPSNNVDKLFSKVELEVRGHDKAVLRSYTTFVKNACNHLKIDSSPVEQERYLRWIPYALRAKFAKKKYKLHYETRTYINKVNVYNLTGSTASTFLEYVQRNIPEGVGMKVTYNELHWLPEGIRPRPLSL